MILGLDISTSIIGMCVISEDKKLHSLSFLNLKKEKNLFEKAIAFKEEIEKYKKLITSVAIEESLVAYRPGYSQAQILSKLSTFNGMCAIISFMVTNCEPVYYNVNTARKLAFPEMKFPKGSDRKEIVQQHVAKFWPEVRWPIGPKSGKLIKQSYDMADSAIISLAHAEVINK